MFHQQSRANGVEGEDAGHLAGVYLAPTFFRLMLAVVQKTGGVDHQPQRQVCAGHMRGRRCDAGLVEQIQRGLRLARQTHYLGKARVGLQLLHQGRTERAAGANHHGQATT